MSKPDASIDPRILKSATEEFLKHGFLGASVKEICAAAGVTTGALYRRYSGKDQLFDAVVEPTIHSLYQMVDERRMPPGRNLTDEALIKAWDMDPELMLFWFSFLYDRYDGFRLLLCCAEGSSKAGFTRDWVNLLTECSYEYYEEAFRRGLTKTVVDRAEMHILLAAFWETIFGPFVSGYSWEQVLVHIDLVCKLMRWEEVLGFPE